MHVMANRLGRAHLLSHSGIDKPQAAPGQYEAAYKFMLLELFSTVVTLLLITKTTTDERQPEKPKARTSAFWSETLRLWQSRPQLWQQAQTQYAATSSRLSVRVSFSVLDRQEQIT